MGSFSSPLSGLKAAQANLQCVSNNLANMDTDGYKDQTLTFSDMFAQTGATNGSGNPVQTGSGVAISSTSTDYTEGSLKTTDSASNMAISGNGFFVTQSASGSQGFTRAGNFTTDNSGQLVTPNGDLVLGFPATGGVVNTSAALQPLRVDGLTSLAVASTMIGITANLYSGTAAISGGTVTPTMTSSVTQDTYTYDFNANGTVSTQAAGTGLSFAGGSPAYVAPAVVSGESLSTYAAAVNAALVTAGLQGAHVANPITVTATGNQLSIVGPTGFTITGLLKQDSVGTATSSTVSVFDSLGTAHTITVSYTKTAANTWNYAVTVPSADITGGTGTDTTVGSGTLSFNGLGMLTSTSNVVPISISNLVDGAAPMTLTGPFGTAANPTITQTDLVSATSATTTNGFASGTLSNYSVSTDGTIQGTFSSGKTLALGQIAVASFANTQGLVNASNNTLEPTAASGSAVIGIAGTGGRGTIIGGSVEQSNVDIAAEFAKLISAQQAYSANAKSVTTFNQLSQATLAMLQ
jgi:flagellar hook protein FlgE